MISEKSVLRNRRVRLWTFNPENYEIPLSTFETVRFLSLKRGVDLRLLVLFTNGCAYTEYYFSRILIFF